MSETFKYVGTILHLPEDQELYTTIACACNEHNQADGHSYSIREVEGQSHTYECYQLPDPTQEEINAQTQARLTSAVQNVLDTEAQKLGYDNCLSVCSYVDTGVQKFDDESRAFRQWRSEVWAKGYEILDEVIAGTREIPTEEELLSELPKLTIVYSTN